MPRSVGRAMRRMSSRLSVTVVSRQEVGGPWSGCDRLRATSDRAKTPMASARMLIPDASSGRPKVRRWTPGSSSVPTNPSRMPSSTMATAFHTDPWASTIDATRPRIIRAKESGAPNCRAMPDSGGANSAMITVETVPAENDAMAAAASAAPARPFRAIRCPSSAVTTLDASPGRFIRMAVIKPPYCAP